MTFCCRNINPALSTFKAALLFALAIPQVLPIHGEEGLSPAQALGTFALEPGIKVELLASEPLVVAPVALCFDERGRMFVAENRGYPSQSDPRLGRIALLEDKDGDGRYESRTEFAEGLTFPNGVLPWKGGLYVTCAPDVLYLKDTNRDGRADLRKVVLTGFATNGSTQLRVSHPTLGPDGWIYLAGGLVGGKVTSPDHPNQPPLDLSRHDVRFRPDTHEYEPTDGKAQFGLTFDEFGHRFFCMNRIHVQHAVLESRYLARNPKLAFSETIENCPGDLVPEPLKGHRPAARIFPLSKNLTTADSHAGTFTAACAVTIYTGTALPAEFHRNVFTCDPAANLVHRDLLVEQGGTFVAKRAVAGREVLASTDDWFRPVFLANGPDGALYLADMYRKTIEHPDYLPEEVRKRTDFKSGSDMGRIWRITGAAPKAKRPQFDQSRAVSQLEHSEGWVRETAFRLVLEAGPQTNATPLRTLAAKSPAPQARFLALRLLAISGLLNDSDLVAALADAAPGVRELAVLLSELRLNSSAALLTATLPLASDPNSHVRFQTALTLGAAPEKDRALVPFAEITRRSDGDRWTHAAVLSSVTGSELGLLEELARGNLVAKGVPEFLVQLGGIIAQDKQVDFAKVLQPLTERKAQLALLAGAGAQNTALNLPGNLQQDLLAEASKIVTDQESESVQVLALRALAATGQGNEVALRALDTVPSPEVQRAALDLLIRLGEPAISRVIQARWRNFSPASRDYLLTRLLSRDETALLLLQQIEAGHLPANVLVGAQRKQLQQRKTEALRTLADKLFGAATQSDRQKTFTELRHVLEMKPDPRSGQEVFLKHCATCHRLDREGHEVGPDLFSIRNQPKEAILLHLVDPDLEIVPGFAAYDIETTDGESFSGLLKSETPSAVTIRMAGGLEQNILRNRIAKLQSSNLSLMPQDLEKALSRQELADLVAYLKGE